MLRDTTGSERPSRSVYGSVIAPAPVMGRKTQGRRANVAAYAARTCSAFFTDGPEPKPLLMRAMLTQLRWSNPKMMKFWASRICAISSELVENVFSRVNRSWISPQAVEFAAALLAENAGVIREVCLDR